MIIGIEAQRANSEKKTGVEHYAKQLILHLAKIDSKNEYILYLRTPPQEWFLNLPKNFCIKVMPFPIFWTQLRLSWEMFVNPPNVLLVPASALPFVHPKLSVVTIHDLAWKYFPDSFTWFMKFFLQWSTEFAVKNTSKIIAVSESTKKDILKYYSVDVLKIAVVYHGFESVNQQIRESVNQSDFELPEKYVLFLSTIQPRKNLEGLTDAFVLLKKENPELPHKLVVVGKLGWKYGSILNKIYEHSDIVQYLNYLNDKQRWTVLKGANLLVLPSFYEGFGMQILESFAANVPVATSNVSSMPEVAKDAAIYFDPRSPKDIARAIKMVLLDKSLFEELRQKGCERLKNFSWEKCALETLAVLTHKN